MKGHIFSKANIVAIIIPLITVFLFSGCHTSDSITGASESTSISSQSATIGLTTGPVITLTPEPTVAPTTVPTVAPTTQISVNAGDYVSFGKYLGIPILWKCVAINNTSVLLVSEYILCQKAFDAAESGTAGTGSMSDMVQRAGSNVWASSNIREWLNSSSLTVTFTSQAPTASAVSGGFNAYVSEPGFLNNFSIGERDNINAIIHDGVTDFVYLLSLSEINSYIGNSDGTRKRQITQSGRDSGQDVWTGDNYWWYWTRSPNDTLSQIVRSINADGSDLDLGTRAACNGGGGVLPALNMNSDILNSGSGTVSDPFAVN